MLASHLNMLGANIFLIIGAIILAIVAFGFLIALWTGLNFWTWRRSVKRADAQRRKDRINDTCQPFPPASRGLCSVCETVHPEVYHLPDGTRFCPRHYAELIQTRTKDTPDERMITLERSLANLVRNGEITPMEAEKWANHPMALLDELQRGERDK